SPWLSPTANVLPSPDNAKVSTWPRGAAGRVFGLAGMAAVTSQSETAPPPTVSSVLPSGVQASGPVASGRVARSLFSTRSQSLTVGPLSPAPGTAKANDMPSGEKATAVA